MKIGSKEPKNRQKLNRKTSPSFLWIALCILSCISTALEALTEGYGMSVEQTLDICCQTGNIEGLLWVIQQQKKNHAHFDSVRIVRAVENLVTGGFDSLLLQFRNIYDCALFDEEQKDKWIDLALEIGYPNTVRTLQRLHFPLSLQQQCKLDTLSVVLSQNLPITPPEPINEQHDIAHGGSNNRAIYHKEYKIGLLYVLHHLRNKQCDFLTLIENLGHRRRHMAGLGRLTGIDLYGIPTNQHTYTYYDPVYALYGKRIHEKYPDLPKSVIVKLHRKEMRLTEMTNERWVHPNGEHREELLNKIAELCYLVHSKSYENRTRELAYDLGRIIWWCSHAPPFLRGTPTIINMLIDALCIYHHREPLVKSPDINCEALLYDNEEEFALYMFYRDDLPRSF